VIFLTGAGISKSAGIPTFRDADDGVWSIGTENYRPEETGTLKYFLGNPVEVWNWTLKLKRLCTSTNPTISHNKLKDIEDLFPKNVNIVTQNVDGLDLRSGIKNLFEIHGNLKECRCINECTKERFDYPIPTSNSNNYTLNDLLCPKCKLALLRPHTMYFDEKYNEKYYFKDTLLKLSKKTGLVITIGTTGLTNLPLWIVENSLQKGGWLVNVDLKENEFSRRAERIAKGSFFKISSDEFLLSLITALKGY